MSLVEASCMGGGNPIEPSLGISPVAASTFRPLRARGAMGETLTGNTAASAGPEAPAIMES
jgi:hypothetical protein